MDFILTRDQIEAMAGLEKTHFLNPQAQRINKSLGDVVGLTKLGVHLIELHPGSESTEYHVHHVEDECVFILSGHATVTMDDEDVEVGPGDFIGYPACGPAHTMRNTGTEALKCLVIGQRLSYDAADYPRLKKRIYRYDGNNDLVDLVNIEHPVMGRKI